MSQPETDHTSTRPPVDIVAAGVISLALVEILFRTASVMQWRYLQATAVAFPWIWTALIGAVVGLRSTAYQWVGFIIGTLTLAGSIVIVFRFRGLWIWPGTFDHYFVPSLAWICGLPVGYLCGILGAIGLRKRLGPAKNGWYWIAAMTVASVITLGLSYAWASEIDSLFPPTRSYVYLALVLPLAFAQYQEG